MGNWNEDIARQEVASKDYEVRRSKGELLYLKKRRELGFLSQKVPLSFHPDGLVRFGDSVMISTSPLSGHAQKYLCSNIFSQLMTPGYSRVTAGTISEPMARNVFVLTKSPTGTSNSKSISSIYTTLIPLHIFVSPIFFTTAIQYLIGSSSPLCDFFRECWHTANKLIQH